MRTLTYTKDDYLNIIEINKLLIFLELNRQVAVNDGDGTGKISTDDRKGRKILVNMVMESTPYYTHAIPTGVFSKVLDNTLTVVMMTPFSRERRHMVER